MTSKIIKSLIAISGLALCLWLFSETAPSEISTSAIEPLPKVSVVNVSPNSAQVTFDTQGIVKPRWSIALTANVKGQISDSFETIQPGTLVKKGDVLAHIDDVEYVALHEQAKADKKSAALELAKVLNEQSVAKKIDSTDENNEFRLLKPHVEAAQAALVAAQKNVNATAKQLNDTAVKAPFDAIVMSKHVAPSQYIDLGDTLYTLASSAAIDIEVNLSKEQLETLQDDAQISATIKDGEGQYLIADMRYIAPAVDPQTRQNQLLLSIDKPYERGIELKLEEQIDVVFSRKAIDNAVIAPASVLTRDNHVWTVVNNALKLEHVDLVHEDAESVMFVFKLSPHESRTIVRYPLSTMIDGQLVNADTIEGDDVERIN